MVIHGSIRMAMERNGLHFYIACPECLNINGESELWKKHLAINVERYFAGYDRSAQCMKHGASYNVTDLVSMPPLADRGIEYKPETPELHAIPAHHLEQDEKGNWIPKSPGLVIPVNILPPDHPASIYLAYRKFDPEVLWDQFRCCFCYKENNDLFYRRLQGGFKVTPQGRLIFFAYVKGVRVGWQARILEIDDDNHKFYWHPYKSTWVAVMKRADEKSRWELLPGYEEWDPAKYFTGHGTRRNSILLGFDAAVNHFRNQDRLLTRWCGLVEGPLDAARFGPPFISRMGKTLSKEQATLLRTEFDVVYSVSDNDEAGEQGKESIRNQFSRNVSDGRGTKLKMVELPAGTKDPGDLTPEQAQTFLKQFYD